MLSRCLWSAVISLFVVASVHAQQPRPSATAAKQGAPPATKPPAPPNEPATQVRPAEPPPGQPVNLKLELTISDQSGNTEPVKKVLSVIVADRANGFIRTMDGPMRLNVDATPQLLAGGNARVRIGIEYMPRQASGTGQSPAMLNQSVTVVLEPGKPFVISQAADPSSDRKITVEARLTVLK